MKIRELKASDATRMLEWMQNTDINIFFQFDSRAATMQSVLSFIQNSQHEDHNIHLAITDQNDLYMGTVSLKNINQQNLTAEYAISMHPEAIGKKYAQYATNSILELAFLQYHLNRVYLNVFSDNLRAIAFYEKFGFSFEGEFKEHIIMNGSKINLKWYRMLRSEFLKE